MPFTVNGLSSGLESLASVSKGSPGAVLAPADRSLPKLRESAHLAIRTPCATVFKYIDPHTTISGFMTGVDLVLDCTYDLLRRVEQGRVKVVRV